MFPFLAHYFSALPGGSLPAFLFLLYPWFFQAALIAILKWKGLVPEISQARLAAAGALSAVNFILLCRNFSYEGLLYQETVVPIVLFFPYVRAQVVSVRRLLLTFLPLLAFVVIEQLKATQYESWSCSIEGNRYLIWAKAEGSALEKTLWLGGSPAFPLCEILFYPCYVAFTFAFFAAVRRVFPALTAPSDKLRFFLPAAFGFPLAVILPLIAWFTLVRGQLPFHAVAAAMSLVLMLLMYAQSARVRRLGSTPLFGAMTVFSFFQTFWFEVQHCGVLRNWTYNPSQELSSLSPWLEWYFPSIPFIGLRPENLPIEELCAYPTLYVFAYCWALWMSEKTRIRIFRRGI